MWSEGQQAVRARKAELCSHPAFVRFLLPAPWGLGAGRAQGSPGSSQDLGKGRFEEQRGTDLGSSACDDEDTRRHERGYLTPPSSLPSPTQTPGFPPSKPSWDVTSIRTSAGLKERREVPLASYLRGTAQ